MSDAIDTARAAQEIIAALNGELPGRRAAAWVSPDAPARLLSQDDLVDELRAAGMSTIARRISRVVIPSHHILLFIADDCVRWRVTDLRDEFDILVDADAEKEPQAKGTSALAVLGMLGGGRS